MPRYVILHHQTESKAARPSHYDLMLEHEGTLLTWALSECPAQDQSIHAEPLADHRMAYLDYEGPISGSRGEVTRWDWGRYEVVDQSPNMLSIEFSGERGLTRAKLDRSSEERHFWTFGD